MDVQFADIKVLSMSGYSRQWRIMPEDITMVDGMPFVKLKATSCGLQNLLLEGNELAHSTPKTRMLTSSVGYAQMMKLRDAAHREETQTPAPSTSCLFDGTAQQKTAKRSRIEVQQQRASQPRASLVIHINVDGVSHPIDVMTPIASRDAMHVMCTTETLGVVIKFLRDEGFTETVQMAKTSGLPQGIYPRGHRFLAVKLGGDGCKKYRTVEDVESGAAWQSMNTDDADDEDTMPCDNEIL
jgi:hypothetical protein